MGIFNNNIKSNLQPTEDVLGKVLNMIVTDCADQFKDQVCVWGTASFVKAFCAILHDAINLHTCEGGLLDSLHPGIEAYIFDPSLNRVCMPNKHTLNMEITVVLYIPTGIIDPAYKIEKQTRYQFDIPVQIPV